MLLCALATDVCHHHLNDQLVYLDAQKPILEERPHLALHCDDVDADSATSIVRPRRLDARLSTLPLRGGLTADDSDPCLVNGPDHPPLGRHRDDLPPHPSACPHEPQPRNARLLRHFRVAQQSLCGAHHLCRFQRLSN